MTEMSLSWPYTLLKYDESRPSIAVTTYPEELLRSRDDMAHYECCAEGQDDMLIVGVQNQAINNFAFRI